MKTIKRPSEQSRGREIKWWCYFYYVAPSNGRKPVFAITRQAKNNYNF
jgi:hypothetical protein